MGVLERVEVMAVSVYEICRVPVMWCVIVDAESAGVRVDGGSGCGVWASLNCAFDGKVVVQYGLLSGLSFSRGIKALASCEAISVVSGMAIAKRAIPFWRGCGFMWVLVKRRGTRDVFSVLASRRVVVEWPERKTWMCVLGSLQPMM